MNKSTPIVPFPKKQTNIHLIYLHFKTTDKKFWLLLALRYLFI